VKEEKMLKDFREFILRGNMLDMAVGIVIGAAFGTVVQSLVDDIIMPPIGWVLGGIDFQNLFITIGPGDYATLAEAEEAGAATINYGLFINSIIAFLIIGLAVFFLIRSFNRLQHREEEAPEEPTTKTCPECLSEIPIAAQRCAFCTSALEVTAEAQA
jgi:large conductance mechanosensitive channel